VPLLVESLGSNIEIEKREDSLVDLEVTSVYPKKLSRFNSFMNFAKKKDAKGWPAAENAKIRIWFSGENIRPPLDEEFDLYLSFDSTNSEKKTFYLPLWVLNLNWFEKPSAHGFISKYNRQHELLKTRRIEHLALNNRNFCCVFANHLDNRRRSAISSLSKLGNVDIYGGAGRMSVSDKFEIARNYNFILCFENSFYPGYVTEKLLEAYQTTAFPLYWGHDHFGFFNQDTFLNFANYDSEITILSIIEDLMKDFQLYKSKLEMPLLKKAYDFEALKTRIGASLEKNVNKN